MSEKLDSERLNRLWKHSLHEENIFNNRLNFFLVFESVLLGVVAMLFGASISNMGVIRIIIVLGIAITVIWSYIQVKQKHLLDLMKACIKGADPDYQMTREAHEKQKWPFSVTWLLAYIIPPLIILVWIALLFVSP